MSRLITRLTFLTLVLLALALMWSCDQPEDVAIPVGKSILTLSAERLPTPPDGMIYELWVSTQPVSGIGLAAGDVVSLGRFSYEETDTSRGFVDDSGNRHDGTFELAGDLFDYRSVIVSVETAGSTPSTPSNIMLADRITGLADIPIRLNFPRSDDLWLAVVRYNMESVSDRNNSSSTDGKGLWFSSYRATLDTIVDTIGWDTTGLTTYDTIYPETVGGVVVNCDSLNARYLDSIVNFRIDTILLEYARDTLILSPAGGVRRIRVSYDSKFAERPDTHACVLRERRNPDVTFSTRPPRTVTLDIFTQDDFALPDYSAYGFVYKGWVVAPIIPAAAGTLTPPGYLYKSAAKNWIPGDDGGMLSTGTFSRIDAEDDANPYTLEIYKPINGGADSALNLPNYPGEDFLDPAALAAATGQSFPTGLNLVPGSANVGTVFITLEPTNMNSATTNFPLIAFLAPLPENRNIITSDLNRPIQMNMLNATGTVPGSLIGGFPEIVVGVDRF